MKKYAAEFIGTFSLVLFGCGSAVIAGISGSGPSGIGLLGIAVAFGFAVVAMAYAIGGISGCHVNPAVTIGVLTAGKMSVKDAIGYIIAQCLGAILASAVLYLIVVGRPDFTLGEWGLGANGWGEGYNGGYNVLSAFLIEMVMTFLFVFVILGTTSKFGNTAMAGLAIGVTLMLIHLVTIPVTGTSVNPARSLGPAILVGGKALSQLWLFFVAPVIGAIVAALLWKFGFEKE
ncbi:MAG TPA: aquaporin Z [Bacteroidales bacterium]|nr:aquaporin Z [Bacteroidales bacterium]HPS72834.1 aquaporin Z [Bacteroidales bacterium]